LSSFVSCPGESLHQLVGADGLGGDDDSVTYHGIEALDPETDGEVFQSDFIFFFLNFLLLDTAGAIRLPDLFIKKEQNDSSNE
jgi:hypothetical protein